MGHNLKTCDAAIERNVATDGPAAGRKIGENGVVGGRIARAGLPPVNKSDSRSRSDKTAIRLPFAAAGFATDQ